MPSPCGNIWDRFLSDCTTMTSFFLENFKSHHWPFKYKLSLMLLIILKVGKAFIKDPQTTYSNWNNQERCNLQFWKCSIHMVIWASIAKHSWTNQGVLQHFSVISHWFVKCLLLLFQCSCIQSSDPGNRSEDIPFILYLSGEIFTSHW